MALYGATEAVLRTPFCSAEGQGRLRQLRFDDRSRQRFLRIESRQPPRKVLQFTHIAGPTMALEPFKGRLVHLLWRQSFTLRLREEVPDEVGDILGTFAQRRQS